MPRRRPQNPFTKYKRRHGLTYAGLKDELGCSVAFLRKLGAEQWVTVSPSLAKKFEDATGGEIAFMDVMRWSYDRLCNGAIRDAA